MAESVGERIALTMRTSCLSEFRTMSGALAMFEIGGPRITFGRVCALLARIPGVEFADFKVPARFTGPARFRFKGADFEVTLAHFGSRVTVGDPLAAHSESAELLSHVKEQLTQRPTHVTPQRLV